MRQKAHLGKRVVGWDVLPPVVLYPIAGQFVKGQAKREWQMLWVGKRAERHRILRLPAAATPAAPVAVAELDERYTFVGEKTTGSMC